MIYSIILKFKTAVCGVICHNGYDLPCVVRSAMCGTICHLWHDLPFVARSAICGTISCTCSAKTIVTCLEKFQLAYLRMLQWHCQSLCQGCFCISQVLDYNTFMCAMELSDQSHPRPYKLGVSHHVVLLCM